MGENKISINRGIPGEIEFSQQENIQAWQKLQYGMFIHWGLYSELGGEWNGKPQKTGYSEQIQMWANIPQEEYEKIAEDFSAEKFDPVEICALAKKAGMKYIVITSKHHDGFSLFDTKTSDYNIVKRSPFKQDAIKLLADECRKQGLKFGLYFSLVDWHQGHEFQLENDNTIPAEMEPMIEGQLRELLTNYGPISEVWFDMSNPTEEQSDKFSQIVRDLQPTAAINGRIWNNRSDFCTLGDNQVPAVTLEGAWQTPASIYRETWGYRTWQVRDDFDGKVFDLATGLVRVISRGGNYLLNIGPRGDGSIVEFEAEVLSTIGNWLDRHEGAVVGARATRFPEQSWGAVTINGKNLYLHLINWPEDGKVTLPGLATDVNQVKVNNTDATLEWELNDSELTIKLPAEPTDDVLPIIRVELNGDLLLIPEKTITIDSAEEQVINADAFDTGYSYADEGHYHSLFRTEVKQTAYITSEVEGQASLKVNGKANPDKNYLIKVGNDTQVVNGKQLTDGNVGPFSMNSSDGIIPLEITVSQPEYPSEDLDLQIESVVINISKE